MRIFSSHPALRWAVPAIAVTVIGGTTLIATSATAKDSLPPVSAQQLLVDLQQAKVDTFSGTVVQKSDLGLPDLPGLGGGSSDTSLTSLISGTHTLQVWADGPEKQRLAIHGTLGETDLIRNGVDVWNWSSQDNTATHTTMSSDAKKAVEHSSGTSSTDTPSTPQDAAAKALAAIDPTTQVTTDPAVDVAGRPAYDLVLTPKGSGSLIGQVRIAVDGEKMVPLGVSVIARDGATVFNTEFTAIDFGTPEAANFAFNAPPGTKVTEKKSPAVDSSKAADQGAQAEKKAKATQQDTKVVGTGWSSVLITKVDVAALSGSTDTKSTGRERASGAASMQQIVNALPTVSGSWGSGRLLAGKAFSVVITDDGRIAAGAVAPETLYRALG